MCACVGVGVRAGGGIRSKRHVLVGVERMSLSATLDNSVIPLCARGVPVVCGYLVTASRVIVDTK